MHSVSEGIINPLPPLSSDSSVIWPGTGIETNWQMQILKSNCMLGRECCKKGFLCLAKYLASFNDELCNFWATPKNLMFPNYPPDRHHGVCWPVTPPPTNSYKRASKPLFSLHCMHYSTVHNLLYLETHHTMYCPHISPHPSLQCIQRSAVESPVRSMNTVLLC